MGVTPLLEMDTTVLLHHMINIHITLLLSAERIKGTKRSHTFYVTL